MKSDFTQRKTFFQFHLSEGPDQEGLFPFSKIGFVGRSGEIWEADFNLAVMHYQVCDVWEEGLSANEQNSVCG